MTRLLCLAFLAALNVHSATSAENHSVTFYVQVVRGTDQAKPQDDGWKAIGPKLSKKLQPVFRWKYYWEVSRHEVRVTKGKTSKVHAAPELDLQIDLSTETQAEMRLYRKGKLTRKNRFPPDDRMLILGGDAAQDEGWFLVVRRDKPSVE